MTPLAQAVLVVCAVVLTVALVVTLATLRRATARAEIVLQLVEREIRPLASQVEALAADCGRCRKGPTASWSGSAVSSVAWRTSRSRSRGGRRGE
jgi:hypothetical protein